MRHQKAFTLIEVMIVVAVIGLLAAIALPQYGDYVVRARITDATTALSDMSVKMEQYYLDNRTYIGACGSPGSSIAARPVNTAYFVFDNPTCVLAKDTYTITATGAGTMASGAKGPFSYTLTMASGGTTPSRASPNLPSGWANTGCGWVSKKDGSC